MFQGDWIHSPTTTSHTSVTGMKIFQPRRMIWSYRKRGKLARTHRNTVTTQKVLPNSQAQFQNHAVFSIHSGVVMPTIANETGAYQPPRNMTTQIAESRLMFAYSARKNIANAMPEYSTMW